MVDEIVEVSRYILEIPNIKERVIALGRLL